MRSRLLEAWGFGTALFLSEIYPVLNFNGLSAYHNSSVTASTLLTALAGMVMGAVIYLCLFHFLAATRIWRGSRFAIAGVLPLMVMLTNRYAITFGASKISARLSHSQPPTFVQPLSLNQALVVSIAYVFVLTLLYGWLHRVYNLLLAFCRLSLMSIGVLGCIATFNLIKALEVHRHDHDVLAFHPSPPAAQNPRARVIWVILDELSYDQTFEHRAPDLKLPNFDALAAQSDVYTHVQPVAFFTDLAVPSLLAGEQLDSLHYDFSRGAQFHFVDTNTYHALDVPNTLIGQAQANQWNVGIVGWWNPYCMIFAGYTQSCHWLYTDWSYGRMRAKYTPLENFEHWAHGFYRQTPGAHLLKVRIQENQDLSEWSQQLLHDDRMDLLFIHLAMPHAPYVYDRHTGQATVNVGSSYMDGLALADKTLGELMKTAEASPRWSQTTFIVQGDHSWRTPIWKQETWTEEDNTISSGGRFDDRPALVVHHPGQAQNRQIANPTPLLHVHDLIQQIVTMK